jgi:hypothetical protein
MTHYLVNVQEPVPPVLDLHVTHHRFGSISDHNLNGHLHYPNDVDRSLNQTVTDKITKYRTDYNNNPNDISFISDVVSTSGRLHSEFVSFILTGSSGN